ncbi:MAG: hypothetical protein AB1505_28740 [Candidatus Latescibacterota bacterium]
MKKRTGFFGGRSGIAGRRRVLELGPVVLALTLIGVLGTVSVSYATPPSWYCCQQITPGDTDWCCANEYPNYCSYPPPKYYEYLAHRDGSTSPYVCGDIQETRCGC